MILILIYRDIYSNIYILQYLIMIHKPLLICKLPCFSFASLWFVLAYYGPLLVPNFSVFSCVFCSSSDSPLFLNFVCCQIYREHESWHHSCPEIKFKIFYSEVSKFRRLNERWQLTMVTYHNQEYSRKCKKHRKYIGTIHTVQNTNVLSYCSIILPLCFPISFTLHNIPIGYKIFSITELHLK